MPQCRNQYKPGVLYVGRRQIVQTQNRLPSIRLQNVLSRVRSFAEIKHSRKIPNLEYSNFIRSFAKIKPSRNDEITMLFTDVDKLCPSRDFLRPEICFKRNSRKYHSREIFRIYSKNEKYPHHSLKQKWTVPIDNGGKIHSA